MNEEERAAVKRFLRNADGVYEEYDAGYTDADAALQVLRGHIDSLRDGL